MTRQARTGWVAGVSLFVMAVAGCHGPSSPPHVPSLIFKTMPPSVQVPISVERLAILSPKTYHRELFAAYARLHASSFQLKARRPSLRIIERFDLPMIVTEQQLQVSGLVSDDTAIRVGRLLGVDSVLIFHIDGPTTRDLMFARIKGFLPPYLVSSKIILVESAEVVFHNVVTSNIAHAIESMHAWSHVDTPWEHHARLALDHGIDQTVADLWHAFQ